MTHSLYRSFSIGNTHLPGNLFLAPLAGLTDVPFRKVCLENGASLCWSEMVSAEALARGSSKTRLLMERAPGEDHLVIQIFLSHYSQALRALPALLAYRPTGIDINCGCPVPKVVKTGAGASLMNRFHDAADIIRALTRETSVPVSVKIRSGWDSSSITCFEAARLAQEAGASFITLHPRTRTQGYSGNADWDLLAQMKGEIDIPLVGSGDVHSPDDARRMLETCRVDAIMIGRAALGNPTLFARTRAYLKGENPPPLPEGKELLDIIIGHLDHQIARKGEQTACREMRKHICAYTKGLPGSAALRGQIVHAETRHAYLSILTQVLH